LYFIAVIASASINRQVLEWKNFMLRRFNCRAALRSPAHITIVPPWHMPDRLEQPLIGAMGRAASQNDPFPIHLQNFGAFAPRAPSTPISRSRPATCEKQILPPPGRISATGNTGAPGRCPEPPLETAAQPAARPP
jgi:2'-5' RNA ligase